MAFFISGNLELSTRDSGHSPLFLHFNSEQNENRMIVKFILLSWNVPKVQTISSFPGYKWYYAHQWPTQINRMTIWTLFNSFTIHARCVCLSIKTIAHKRNVIIGGGSQTWLGWDVEFRICSLNKTFALISIPHIYNVRVG